MLEFLLLRDNTECFFPLFLWGIEKVIGRHAWKKVDITGDRRKAEDSVWFFIYTPIIALGLASMKNRHKLLAIIILFPSIALSAQYFLLSQLVLPYHIPLAPNH